jgi:L-glutamine---4-(methylsulfanyl)-2-oxobutanoate aminotransferase
VRTRPERLDRLPQQYFAALLTRVAEVAAQEGDVLVDLGRGNPEVGPPAHVVEALSRGAERPDVHGYAHFRGLPELKEAVARRYDDVYGVALDPEHEVAIVAGGKFALIEIALVGAERGDTILLPDPGYPDYRSAAALADATVRPFDGFDESAAVLYLNYPSNPTARVAPDGLFEDAVAWGERYGGLVFHDFAYGDLVFDGRAPSSFLAAPGAREVGVELYSMSKSYGMAGWRLAFVVGNAEIVARINELQDHLFAGIFEPLQRAAIAALGGPQDSVEARRATYERRRDRALAALPGVETYSEGSFYVWLCLPEGVRADDLLVEHRIALAPGEGFGARGAGWARLSLAVGDDVLDLGLERLEAAFAMLST